MWQSLNAININFVVKVWPLFRCAFFCCCHQFQTNNNESENNTRIRHPATCGYTTPNILGYYIHVYGWIYLNYFYDRHTHLQRTQESCCLQANCHMPDWCLINTIPDHSAIIIILFSFVVVVVNDISDSLE